MVEDKFPAGRPALETVGVTFTSDVSPYELMKIRILNGGHAAIAYPAGLLDIHFVHEAMADEQIRAFLEKLTKSEIQPVVPPPPNTSLDDYRELIARRFANPKIGDTIQRLCFDGSNRQPKFILPTVADRLKSGASIQGLALVSALWCRYCYGESESGKPIAPNDPSWDALQEAAKPARNDPRAFLELRHIFGDLAEQSRLCPRVFRRALGALGARRSIDSGRLSVGQVLSGSDDATMKLKDKVALVTGGARGIGAAIADRYVAEGARVAIADISLAQAEETAARHGDKAIAVALDVTKTASIEAAVESVVQRWGGVDILVNNAAIFDMAPIVEVTEASYDKVFAVNVRGLFFTLQAVAKRMIARGQGGKIINMASQAGRRGEGLVAVYCASKAAVISLTQSAGLDLIKHRINVNGIAPGVVDTPMWAEVDALFAKYEHRPLGEKKRLVGEAVPFGRMGLPDDHAGAALFLASSDSDYVVAQTLNVDGGNWMS